MSDDSLTRAKTQRPPPTRKGSTIAALVVILAGVISSILAYAPLSSLYLGARDLWWKAFSPDRVPALNDGPTVAIAFFFMAIIPALLPALIANIAMRNRIRIRPRYYVPVGAVLIVLPITLALIFPPAERFFSSVSFRLFLIG